MDQCCHRFYLLLFIDVVTEEVRTGLFHEFLYVNDLVLTNDSIKGIQRKQVNWKESLKSKSLKPSIKQQN